MNSVASDRIVVQIAAIVYDREIGELIAKGERLGYLGGHIIKAPFDGLIRRIVHSLDGHAILITLKKAAQS